MPRNQLSRFAVVLGTQAILHSADMLTTAHALRLAVNVREANPLLAPFTRRPEALVAVSGAVEVLQVYTIARLHQRHPKFAMAWAAILLGTEAYAVTNNLRVAGQVQRARAGAR